VPLTPVEVRHVRFSRRPLGYRRGSVDEALLDIADSFEDVWRSRADLADRVEALEGELVRHKELETLLRTTLVSAERAAAELKEQAKREAGRVIEEAHAEARAVLREAAAERERLERESRRIRSLLRSALDTVDLADGDDVDEDEIEVAPGPERWEAA
jgi:cell division initiation protein